MVPEHAAKLRKEAETLERQLAGSTRPMHLRYDYLYTSSYPCYRMAWIAATVWHGLLLRHVRYLSGRAVLNGFVPRVSDTNRQVPEYGPDYEPSCSMY